VQPKVYVVQSNAVFRSASQKCEYLMCIYLRKRVCHAAAALIASEFLVFLRIGVF
jgi:hypothetical protein